MVNTESIPRLTQAQANNYRKMRALAEEEKRLNARMAEINQERKAIGEELSKVFGDREFYRVNSKLILQRKITTVEGGIVERKPYSYSRWIEVEG